MSQPIIQIENIGKAYRLGQADVQHAMFRDALVDMFKAPFRRLKELRKPTKDEDLFWALRNVSFDVHQGEVVGIIGRNGAGKSTLLKILSRITEPTEGQVTLRGRVASLLEVGTGFHPELTGRENVYLNGAILGMSKAEIARKFDEIVAFAEIEKFLDTPVKRYSSGMYVRLAFAVAAHLEPEILIVDEVLAVGDAEFQKKCLGKMGEVTKEGRTILFVSHNMAAVQTLCPRAIALRNGKLVEDGKSTEVIRSYLGSMASAPEDIYSLSNPDRTNSGEFRFLSGCILDLDGHPTENVISGQPIAVQFTYEADRDLDDLGIGFTIFDEADIAVTHINTSLQGASFRSTGRAGTVTCSIPRNPFALGNYSIAVAAHSNGQGIDLIPGAISFGITDSVFFKTLRVPDRAYSTVYVDHEWAHRVDER